MVGIVIRQDCAGDRVVPVVGRGSQPKNPGHHIVYVNVFKRLDDNALLERRAVRDKDRPHRGKLIVVAVPASQGVIRVPGFRLVKLCSRS